MKTLIETIASLFILVLVFIGGSIYGTSTTQMDSIPDEVTVETTDWEKAPLFKSLTNSQLSSYKWTITKQWFPVSKVAEGRNDKGEVITMIAYPDTGWRKLVIR